LDGEYLFVGDIMDDIEFFPWGPGAVFAFRALPGSGWELAETLSPGPGSRFGWAIAADEDRLAVTRYSSGEVWIYARTPGEDDWTPTQVLQGSPNSFGNALAMRGDLLLVTEPRSRAHLYQRDRGGPDAWGLVVTISGISAFPFHAFSGAAIGENAFYLGAGGASASQGPGLVRSFVRDPTASFGWRAGILFVEPHQTPDFTFGTALAAGDGVLAVGAPKSRSMGRAYALRVHQTDHRTAPGLVPR
jgi:hypothetical protein